MWSNESRPRPTISNHVQHMIKMYQALPLLTFYLVKGRGEPGLHHSTVHGHKMWSHHIRASDTLPHQMLGIPHSSKPYTQASQTPPPFSDQSNLNGTVLYPLGHLFPGTNGIHTEFALAPQCNPPSPPTPPSPQSHILPFSLQR